MSESSLLVIALVSMAFAGASLYGWFHEYHKRLDAEARLRELAVQKGSYLTFRAPNGWDYKPWGLAWLNVAGKRTQCLVMPIEHRSDLSSAFFVRLEPIGQAPVEWAVRHVQDR